MGAAVGFDRLLNVGNRLIYHKVFMRPPGLNADIQNAAESVREIVDTDFEILGTNSSSDDATIDTEGGVKIQTDGADGDEVIILPHLDASQSAWATTQWDTAKEVHWETLIEVADSGTVANMIVWAGLKLTNTKVIATDDDQVMFRYEDDVGSGQWQFITSRAGVDTQYTVPTSVVAAVAAATRYKLRIEIYSDRTVQGFINDVPVRATDFPALTSLTTLIPYIGVAADGAAAAKDITVKYITISRLY
jgi:hypothetical protein